MSRVIIVHGIGQQLKGPETLLSEWLPALRDGLVLAGHTKRIEQSEITVGFYGDIFRPSGARGLDGPLLDSSDVVNAEDEQWLRAWWEEAARLETAVDGPGDPGRIRTPNWVQRALNALSHSTFFAGCSEHLLVSNLRQVRRYFTEPTVRQAIQSRATECITSETQVVVAHSLGSVVAYEALCAHPPKAGLRLITVGSPLGIRNLVFDRLIPAPVRGQGCWPPAAADWVNIADRGDVVALAKRLAPLFSDRVTDLLVDNGAKAHDICPYLTARETGRAIAEALRS